MIHNTQMKTHHMKTQKILLAGATGYLGKYIAAELIKQSYPTRIIARDRNKVNLDSDLLEAVEA